MGQFKATHFEAELKDVRCPDCEEQLEKEPGPVPSVRMYRCQACGQLWRVLPMVLERHQEAGLEQEG